MTEGEIDKLPIKNYQENPRKEIKYIGETTAIRQMDPDDFVDMSRSRGIQAILPDDFTDIDSTPEELIEEGKDTRPGYDRSRGAVYTFAISGSSEAKGLENEEIGEMQGILNFYRDEYVPDLLKKGKIPPVSRRNMVLNVLFARHPDKAPGQMASALRQSCTYLSRIETARQDQIEALRNRKSRKTAPELIITGYASDLKSERILEKAGFVNKDSIELNYKPENKIYKYTLFVLDWEKLQRIMHENADATLKMESPLR